MSKKYKHINIPRELIAREGQHDPNVGRNIPTPELKAQLQRINTAKQRNQISRSIGTVERFYKRKNKSVSFNEDKDSNELKIKFYGGIDPQLLDRYRIEIYRKDIDNKDNATIFGKIRNKRITNHTPSDFERFKEEILRWQETGELRSVFERVKEVKPLSLNQIIEKSLKEEYIRDPEKELVVDISFTNDNIVGRKLDAIKENYSNKFISKVNTDLVHFCRVKANFNDIKATTSSFDGIIDIEHGPIYDLKPSELEEQVEGITIKSPGEGATPLLMFDGSVNERHFTVKGAVVENRSIRSIYEHHGTAVASLLICGTKIAPNSVVEQKNRVIAINYFEDPNTAEENMVRVIEEFARRQPILLINLSVNKYFLYRRKKIDNFTVLLDELAHKYNCLFFVSAGNLFTGNYWNKTINDLCRTAGYPKYFNLDCSKVLPPADSINNISVGSISYQESVNSLSKIKNPSPITRANLKKNTFIKPDLVHFDSNLTTDLQPEGNGVYMASERDGALTRLCGTSFATPLVTHDAGVLHSLYPSYNTNTIKALIIHFTDEVKAEGISNKKMRKQLVGFGLPNLDAAMHSLNTSSCLVVEDDIGVNKRKRIRFPIPSCIAGDHRKRLRIRKTLVYNPKVNPNDPKNYNPINITAQLVREDEKKIGTGSSREKIDGAHKKSNVKKYKSEEVSTREHTGAFWYIDITSEARGDYLSENYVQPYSLIISLEDIKEDQGIDLHEEAQNMIEIETHVEVPIEV